MTERRASASRRILLVDDDDAIRRLVGKLLETSGYTFIGVSHGAEALEKLRESNPDLILLDHVLPDMDGVLLLELIRARSGSRQTPIIYLTGETDIVTKKKAFETGAIDYVTKPFDPIELLARVGTQIRSKDQRDAEARETERPLLVAQQAREDAEQRFRALVENFHCLVCELDSDLLVVYASPNYHDILDYHPADVTGKSWLSFVHPDDRADIEFGLRNMLAVGVSRQTVVRFRNRLNQWRWLDVSGSPLRRGENPVGLLLASRDITQSKETRI